MSNREKLIERAKTIPKDFTFNELETLLKGLGYELDNKGKTSGSRVSFCKDGVVIMLHKPHNGNPVLAVYLKEIIAGLIERGEI